jgi:CubicO group peptidase (beta-lactamase class C family)
MFKQSLPAVILIAGLTTAAAADSKPAGWSEKQIAKLPKTEKPIHLFNGKNLTGWEGQTKKYFSVKDGVIVAKNGKDNAPKASTYLVTKKKYRNFRLIFEGKLVKSETHSGIALWGKTVKKSGDPYSYMGHLVMFPSGYGYYDLYRRNSIYQDKKRVARKAGKQHGWNRMEILAIGNRIRFAINGVAAADWSDPQPEYCQPGPIGLQLHSNRVPQEVQFRGLILTENPVNRLVTAKGKSGGSKSPRLSQVPGRMLEFVGQKKVAGIVTLVANRKHVLQLAAVGYADIEKKKPMTRDTLFAIASMTKPITGTAVMILKDQGKLSLDDPVSKYIPEFKSASLKSGLAKRQITIRDLVTHTSGLVGSQQNTGSLKQTAINLAKRPLGFEPGAKWQYSPGMSVAGRIVEVVSGEPFDQFLQKHIFDPLNMKDTTFHPAAAQQKRLARIYRPSRDKKSLVAIDIWIAKVDPKRSPNPSGGLFSTASDLAKFYQMILNGGDLKGKRILSAAAVKEMTTIQSGDLKTGFTPGNGWGVGWCIVRKPQGVTAMLSPGTCGHGGAFGTQGWIDRKNNRIYVLMIQRSGFGNGDASDIRATFQRLAAP